MKKITITIPLDIALEIATYGEYGKVSRNTQHYMEKQVKQMGYEKELNDLRDQKLKASAENLSDKKDKFDLDHYHYHEFLERCALLNNVIEEICDHPVKNAHGDLNDQVNKILDECGELYVMAGNKKFDFNDSVAADIRIN